MIRPIVIAAAFVLAALTSLAGSWAWASQRRFVPPGTAVLDHVLPARFGAWSEVPTAFAPVDPFDTGGEEAAARTYDVVATRTFRREDGTEVMLTFAYGRVQEQESKIHRPELCYFAQGYAIGDFATMRVADLPAASFVATSPERSETVVYWIRIGGTISASAWHTRAVLLWLGLRHIVPDGILVRASILAPQAPDGAKLSADRAALADFLTDAALAPRSSQRWMLTGGPLALSAARRSGEPS
jgi:EpsI family protein